MISPINNCINNFQINTANLRSIPLFLFSYSINLTIWEYKTGALFDCAQLCSLLKKKNYQNTKKRTEFVHVFVHNPCVSLSTRRSQCLGTQNRIDVLALLAIIYQFSRSLSFLLFTANTMQLVRMTTAPTNRNRNPVGIR